MSHPTTPTPADGAPAPRAPSPREGEGAPPREERQRRQKRLAELTDELSSLNRVFHKLAMTPAAGLPRVLHLLLPRLLARIGKNDDAAQEERRRRRRRRREPSSSGSRERKRKSPSPPPGATTAAAASVDGGRGDAEDAAAGDRLLADRVAGAHDAVHNKLVEMVGHAMARVREDRDCGLPCAALLELLTPPVL